jgi:hypothetical protein
MRFRSLMFAAVAVAATLASHEAVAENNVDAMRQSMCGMAIQDPSFSCNKLHGALFVLDRDHVAGRDLAPNRTETFIHSLTGDLGIAYTRSRGLRALGASSGRPEHGMWLIGLQRDSSIIGSKPMFGIGYHQTFRW